MRVSSVRCVFIAFFYDRLAAWCPIELGLIYIGSSFWFQMVSSLKICALAAACGFRISYLIYPVMIFTFCMISILFVSDEFWDLKVMDDRVVL